MTQNRMTQTARRPKKTAVSLSKRQSNDLFTKEPAKTQKNITQMMTQARQKYGRVVVCSGVDEEAKALVKETCKELPGKTRFEGQVTERTTHLIVTKPCNKTEKLLLAIIFGVWIVDISFIHKSKAAGNWVSEDTHELRNFLPAIGITRYERQTWGPNFRLSLLKGMNIFVHPDVAAGQDSIENFAKLMGAKLTVQALAKYAIADSYCEGTVTVQSAWITDSISAGHLKSIKPYQIKPVSHKTQRPVNNET